MVSNDNGLELVAAPEKVSVTLRNGEEHSFGPVTMGRMKEFKSAVMPIAGLVMALIDQPEDSADWQQLLDHSDDLCRAVSAATGISAKAMSEMLPDECLLLTVKVVRVNIDFFAQSLLPMFAKSVGQMGIAGAVENAKTAMAGATASRP